jgi:hypothetical protein
MKRADPAALYSPTLAAAFDRYCQWYLGRQFGAIRLAKHGVPRESAEPTIFFCNHPSWWDPLVVFVVLRRLFPNLQVFGPMQAAAAERYSVLRRVGALPVDTRSFTGARSFLVDTESVLTRGGCALAIAAQGTFCDSRLRPTTIGTSVARLLLANPERRAVPIALEYTFWNERKPEALVRFGRPVGALGGRHRAAAIAATTAVLSGTLESAQDSLAGLAMTRSPDRFETLLAGHRGGTGAYDWYERARSWLRRRRFDASHGSIRT